MNKQEPIKSLSGRDLERYSRQILIPGWGEEGQKKLKNATIGVAGAGGLGSTILMQLAVCGAGTIIFADRDTSDLSNLNRQVLHWEEDIGSAKADSAGSKLGRMNSDITIQAIRGDINSENIEKHFAGVDLLIDGLDNFESRLVLNEYCVKQKIPLVHGAIWGFEGRVCFVSPGKSACLGCIYHEIPPQEVFPVLGVSPALIATIQVSEAIKYLTGLGTLLKDTILVCDLETNSFVPLSVKRDPKCPICGDSSEFHLL